MDAASCAALASLELLLARSFAPGLLPGSSSPARLALLLFLAHYLALKIYRIFIYPFHVSPYRHLPGPKDGHFFLGQLPHVFRQQYPYSLYVDWVRRFPDAPVIRYLTFANNEVLVPLTPDAFREVLQTRCYDFAKPRGWLRMVVEFAGYGIVTFDGDEHVAARKMLHGSFSPARVRQLQPIFQEKARDLCALFDKAIAEGGGRSGGRSATGVVNAIDVLSRATLDIMGVTTLGVELSNLRGYDADSGSGSGSSGKSDFSFKDAYNDILAPSTLGKVLMFANSFIPVRWLPLEENRKFLRSTARMRKTLVDLIRRRRGEVARAGPGAAPGDAAAGSCGDLLTSMIQESAPGRAAEDIPEDHLVGHLLQFMVAGHETSATVLAWGMYAMARDQAVQDTLRSEIQGLLKECPEPTPSDIEKLGYMDNFIKEILRVYNPSATTHREAVTDLTVAGVPIAAGTTLDVVPAVTMLNPEIWNSSNDGGGGGDVDAFDPDRWSASRLTPAQASPYVFSAFSNGPRICIGKGFALLEIKTVLVEVVGRFRLVGVEGAFSVEVPSLTSRPSGLRIRLERVGDGAGE